MTRSLQDWSHLRSIIAALTREVSDEIHAYPAPIPACDAQFNRLLELRRLLPDEMQRLDGMAGDSAASIEAFVAASPCRTELSALLSNAGKATA